MRHRRNPTAAFGARLRTLRQAQGWGQVEAATRLGVDQSTLSYLERGLRGPSVELLAQLAAVYVTSMDALWLGTP